MRSLLLRELKLAFLTKGGFGLPLVFYLAIAVLIPLGIGPDTEVHRMISIGVLWAAALLANLVSLQRLFQEDIDDGTLERLVAAPLPLEAFTLAKIVSCWLATGLPICLIAPLIGVLLNLPQGTGIAVLLTLLAGTPALSAIGVLGAALTAGTTRGAMLASVLVVPFCIPTLIFGSIAAASLSAGADASEPVAAVLAISLACAALIPFASARVLRINLQ